jgi:hypothetical protein
MNMNMKMNMNMNHEYEYEYEYVHILQQYLVIYDIPKVNLYAKADSLSDITIDNFQCRCLLYIVY